MSNRIKFIGRYVVLLGVWLMCTPASRMGAAQNETGLAVKISQSPFFTLPLVPVGSSAPTEAENSSLWSAIETLKNKSAPAGITALEGFLSQNPESPWAPSIHANLGRYYENRGRYTRAMDHWQKAWDASRQFRDGPGKQVADYTFAFWTQILAGLGRIEALQPLFRETEGRTFDAGPLQQMVLRTRENYSHMLGDPGHSYQCGTFALSHVLLRTKGVTNDVSRIMATPSPVGGFSMLQLMNFADEANLNLVAVEWRGEKKVIVPSIVHWKQNHYGAIVAQRRDSYEIVDAPLGKPRWMKQSEIEDEASGYFLIPRDSAPSEWRVLTSMETAAIHGKGRVYEIEDPQDSCGNGSGGGSPPGSSGGPSPGGGVSPPYVSLPSGDSGSSGSCGCSGGQSCPVCTSPFGDDGASGGNSGGRGPAGNGSGGGGNGGILGTSPGGMPMWQVSEPYINVWLHDEPLGYNPGLGIRVSFSLSYKQRDATVAPATFSTLGSHWNCSWLSYIVDDPDNFRTDSYLPGGGSRIDNYVEDGTSAEAQDGEGAPAVPSRGIRYSENATNYLGTDVLFPNGARNGYHYVITNGFTQRTAFLSEQVDPYGHTNRFVYENTNGIHLIFVVDADGRTNRLYYTNTAFPHAITGVTDPFGRHTTLEYDTNGVLYRITDVLGISNSFKYDGAGWVTNLITPYGTTTFQYTTNSTSTNEFGGEYDSVYNPSVPVRTVRIIDPSGGTNAYMLLNLALAWRESEHGYVDWYLDGFYQTDTAPTDAYGATLDGIENEGYNQYRNSFHWGPRQAAGLPNDLTKYTITDLYKARTRHWSHSIDPLLLTSAISQCLSMEQLPSPDGVTPGQRTFFGYEGRGYGWGGNVTREGTNAFPSLVARVVGDGTTWYQAFQRDEWEHPTNVVETYSTGYGATPLTRTNQYVYANSADLVQIIGPRGETVAGYAYDSRHHIIRETNAVGDVAYFTYDGAGRLTSYKSFAGLTTTNIYFSSGEYTNFVQTRIDVEISRTNTFTYTNNLVWTQTDERGNTTTNAWDNLSRLTVSSDLRGAITYTYDKLDLVRVVDRMGYTNTYGYDNVRRKTAETNALGNYTLYNYCSCGALDSIRDMAGNFTFYHYDNAGRRIQTVGPDGYALNYNYNLMGQATNVADNGGYSVTNWFNNQGLEYAVSNAFGQVKLVAYDIEDLATNSVDANGVVTVVQYDDLHRMRSRAYPDGGVERFGYTARGLVAYTNQLNFVTRYGYDEARRKIAETNANLEITYFGYSPASDLLTLTDPKSQTTSWNYDRYGRVTNKVDTLNNPMFLYTYDADNRLGSRWTPAKGTTTYYYDKVGNLTNITYPISPAITLRYDKMNRLTNMVDGVGTTVYGYDAVGQLLSEDGPWTDDTVSYSYDKRLRTGLNVAAPNASAWVQTYGYDSARRMTNITSPAGAFRYIYSPTRHLFPQDIVLPNGVSNRFSYDSVARVNDTRMQTDSHLFCNETYVYNVGGQRTTVERDGEDTSVDYTYDKIGQLIKASGTDWLLAQPRPHEQFGYGYDAAGNLHLRTNNALVQTFNVNSLNELTDATRAGTYTVAGAIRGEATSVTVNSSAATLYGDYTFASTNNTLANGNNTFTAVAADGYGRTSTDTVTAYLPATNSFVYDANGNLTSDGQRSFAYDDENQLISVWVTNVWRSDFAYDGKLRRRARFESKWVGGAWMTNTVVRYVYDGNLVVQERDANNLPSVTYTRGKDLSGSLEGAGGIGGLLARTENSAALGVPSATYPHAYYHADANGNVTCLVDSGQVVVAKYLYDPFGSILSQSGTLADANRYRFSSKEFHATSGLVYYLYRYYEPNLQRWLNKDPIEEQGGIDLYGFVFNDPISAVDLRGLDIVEIPLPNDWPLWPRPRLPRPRSYNSDRPMTCYGKMKQARQKALDWADKNKDSYDCGNGMGINDYPGKGKSWSVPHCVAGYFAHKAGAGLGCIAAANVLHETWEVIFLQEWRKGVGQWFDDTLEDMTSVFTGAQLDSLDDCIPCECKKKAGK